MFWNWFTSDRRVIEALEASSGYDLSPVSVTAPANTEHVVVPADTQEDRQEGCKDYCFSLPKRKGK